MIIDKKNNLVFIHIPKTGGTSIHQWLSLQNNQTVSLWGCSNGIDYAHLTLSQALTLLTSFPKDSFKIAFVRHPYDRIYSAYLQPYRQMYPDLTLDEFVKHYVSKVDENNPDPKLVHLWPMYLFTCINGVNQVDFVGKMETWRKDIDFVKNRFKLKGTPGHLNQSNRLGDDPVFTSESLKIIDKVYKKDFEWFSYKSSMSNL